MNPDKLFDYLEGRLPASERAALEKRLISDKQLQRELAVATLTPAPLGVSEISVPAAAGKLDVLADEVVTIASRFGGSAAKGLQDRDRLTVLVHVPSNREQEFRAAIESIGGER